MDITPILTKGRQLITGYGNNGFKINNEYIAGSLLVFHEETLAWNALEDTVLDITHFAEIINQTDNIELLLVGTGSQMKLLDPAIMLALKEAGIATECMDTGAACRTFNVLLSEERKVAAAIIAI